MKNKKSKLPNKWILFCFLIVMCVCVVIFIYSQIVMLRQSKKTISENEIKIDALELELDIYRNPRGGAIHHGKLSVEDGKLLDKMGEQVQLLGVSSHGIMWYPQYVNYRSLQTLREKGANVFRLAMYPDGKQGYVAQPETSVLMLRMMIENVLGADMYAIVDWHVLEEENPNVYVNDSVKFFDEISKLYCDEPGVIYEICNEPNGDTNWSDIKAYADKVIPVIRKNAPHAIILVGTPSYSTRIEDAIEDPLLYDNILYSFHFYADMSDDSYRYRLSEAQDKGIGIFVSEWGMGKLYSEVEFKELSIRCKQFLDFLGENEISWVCWALSNKEEGHAILQKETQQLSGWSDQELTPYGQFIFEQLEFYEDK